MRPNPILHRGFRCAALLLCGLFGLAPDAADADSLIITLDSPTVLSISDTTGSFTLVFPNFVKGTLSSLQSVTYRIQANKMAAGTVQGAVSASLSELFPGIDLQADVDGYQNLGKSNFGLLQEVQAGPQNIETAPAALADKTPGTGSGDNNLDGNLTVTWRAKLTTDTAAGQNSRFLVVTLKES